MTKPMVAAKMNAKRKRSSSSNTSNAGNTKKKKITAADAVVDLTTEVAKIGQNESDKLDPEKVESRRKVVFTTRKKQLKEAHEAGDMPSARYMSLTKKLEDNYYLQDF